MNQMESLFNVPEGSDMRGKNCSRDETVNDGEGIIITPMRWR